MSQRIKGLEVECVIVVDNVPESNTTAIKSFEITLKQDILTEEYLGEKSTRKDAIFKGLDGKMELHAENGEFLKLFKKITDKSTRRVPGIKINIKATLNFPNGERPIILIQDVEFGDLPLAFGSRADYGTIALTFETGQNVAVIG